MNCKQYTENVGIKCPNCWSQNIVLQEANITETDENTAVRNAKCNNCKAHWEELWKLDGYDPIDFHAPEKDDDE